MRPAINGLTKKANLRPIGRDERVQYRSTPTEAESYLVLSTELFVESGTRRKLDSDGMEKPGANTTGGHAVVEMLAKVGALCLSYRVVALAGSCVRNTKNTDKSHHGMRNQDSPAFEKDALTVRGAAELLPTIAVISA